MGIESEFALIEEIYLNEVSIVGSKQCLEVVNC